MIDLHVHILPGLDDGPKDEDAFLAMARAAVDDGITDVIATPHHMNGIYETPPDDVRVAVDWANDRLDREGIPLRLHPGHELAVHDRLMETLRSGNFLALGGAGRYVLLELRDPIPETFDRLLYEVRLMGFLPVIAHAERYPTFQREPNRLYRFVKNGALVQLTAGSILGIFGKEAQKWSLRFFEHRLVHFVASDAHKDTGARGFLMTKAYQFLAERYGPAEAETIRDNARRLLEGRPVFVEEPERIRVGWKFFR
ncbi:MAG: tyrosine protein phosphatase [Hydrogenibacillus schlegelii]|uniref:Tyrosine-protein phosphatase n=1 Tax=Hydrogenibacillus schlegelii TaxID=1484 RepID=A0A947GGL2_HYDSH|nr:tyrosine protein phosphatase [Hydrogenibacillus schlegelii]